MPNIINTPISKGTPPVKIDTVSGNGVPGGYDVSNHKPPTNESLRLNSTIAAIKAKKADIIFAIQSGNTQISPDVIKKLDGMLLKANSKLEMTKKIPEFSNPVALPAPSRIPTVPDFASLGIPAVPSSGNSLTDPVLPPSDISLPEEIKIPIDAEFTSEFAVQPAPLIQVVPPDPTPVELAASAAAEADASADVAKTHKARNAAASAKHQAKESQDYQNKSDIYLNKARVYENEANTETNSKLKAALITKANKLKTEAAEFKTKSKLASEKAQNFAKIAKSEIK